MSPSSSSRPGAAAFLALLLLACLMAANHIAARIAFDHGLGVPTAVAARSGGTALVVGLLAGFGRVSWALTPRQRRAVAGIGALIALQSGFLYSAVARLPVALALLAFNSYPLWTALAAWAIYRQRPPRRVLVAMPVILAGLALALDVTGAVGGLGAQAHWQAIGAGVAFAVGAAAVFGLVLACTQYELTGMDGRVRTALTMAVTGICALAVALAGGLQWPDAGAGWWGLALLTLLYGTGITMLFTILPRLGVVGSSPILNVEPVAALLLGWAVLGQRIAPLQVAGAAVVVAAVMALGLVRR